MKYNIICLQKSEGIKEIIDGLSRFPSGISTLSFLHNINKKRWFILHELAEILFN